MKYFVVFVLLACVAFTAFSQSYDQERYQALSDSMGNAVNRNNDKLADFDDRINDEGNSKTYTNYRGRYDRLTKALGDSEYRLDFLIRTNDRKKNIQEERDNYADLVSQLETMKSDYDSWLNKRK